ncbi:hypothetical protein [Desulfosporosinus sp. BG]|uniref:ribonuclease toxin HepT-like protein n=1 Tax=Desulfosporosinus sp. BG TaxID=1633135 RepID=UPI00083B229A|nr:hypothetical protein [Desulfosporosinus sp. BG]
MPNIKVISKRRPSRVDAKASITLRSQIIFEIKQIDELFTSFSELLEKSKVEEPTLIELTAIGSILHSFYNGIENIFKTIGKNIDGKIPSGNHWHKQIQ